MPLTPSDLPDEIRATVGEIRQLVLPPQGMTSEVAVVESRTGRCVVKRAWHPLYMRWLREEYRLLTALEPLSLPIPHPYQLVERTTSDGDECWLVMSYLPGTTLAHTLDVERDPDLREHIVRQWGAILRQIHATPAPPELAPRSATWLDERLQQARYNLAHHAVDGDDALLHSLEARRPPLVPQTLIHGELYPSNVLVDPPRVCPVDWEMAAIGPGVIDLAALCGGWETVAAARLTAAYGPVDASDLARACLHLALQWLGWSAGWKPPPEHSHDWLGEALALVRELDL